MDLNNLEHKLGDIIWKMSNVDTGSRTTIGVSRDYINMIKGSFSTIQDEAVDLYERRRGEFDLTQDERTILEGAIERYKANFKYGQRKEKVGL